MYFMFIDWYKIDQFFNYMSKTCILSQVQPYVILIQNHYRCLLSSFQVSFLRGEGGGPISISQAFPSFLDIELCARSLSLTVEVWVD